MIRPRVLCLLVLLCMGSTAHALDISISIPAATGEYVKGSTPSFQAVINGGDGRNWVVWTFYDGTGDVQEGEDLRQVTHSVPNAGAWAVTVEVWADIQPNGPAYASDIREFWVLWVTLGTNAGDVHLDNGGGQNYYNLNGHMLTLGRRDLGWAGWRTGIEYVGSCVPDVWVQPVSLRRVFGSGGGKCYNGPNGDQLVPSYSHNEDDDDTSDAQNKDELPQSECNWFGGGPYRSWGAVYDTDWPGYSNKTEGICRFRANWKEWGEWGAVKVSDDRYTKCAASASWDGNQWVVDPTYDGGGDNSAGAGTLPNTNWNLQ